MMDPNSLVVPDGTRSSGHVMKLMGFKAVPIALLQAGGWARVLQRPFIIKASVIL